MPRPQKRGRRADADKEFRVDPTEEDEEDDEEEPVADDDDDEEALREKQREVDAKNGLDLWGDVQRDKTKSPKGPLAFLQGNNTLGAWRPGRKLPVELVKAYRKIGHPLQSCKRSRQFVATLAKICVEADVPFPMPGKGYTNRTWIAMLLAWRAPMKKGGRRRLQLERAAFLTSQLLGVSATASYKFATPKPGACKLCSAIAIKLLKIFPLADEITYRDYIKVKRVGFGFDLTLLKKKKLYRDHLELSLLFRGWVCNNCNARKLHKLDSLSSDDYKVFGRRVYVNCTTFI
ncbi:unnamed protein product [Pelagomonas calceolata]|uniref:Uncharacterized protein n=1 Tax=Pelagomonas calceolata TaxID=35677 RepID=A0A8J2SRV6_9STRA|nr:unnamed protein product [Pelagomonas calceolata]